MSLHQPLAVIGIGVCFPFASNFAELKTRLKPPGIGRTSTMKWENKSSSVDGYQFSELAFDYKKFGIPPIFRQAVSTETLLALMAVDDALADLDVSQWDLDRTDCFCGTSFGNDATYRNAVKVAAIKAKADSLEANGQQEQVVDQFKSTISQHFAATSHDRVGEMASSIPARIAHYVGSRGKCMTLDSLDLTGVQLLQTADDSFRHADSEVAILTTFQRFNSPLLASMLKQQGVDSKLTPLCEGATSLVVRPLDEALAAGNPILALLSELDVEQNDVSAASSFQCQSPLGYSLANQVFQQIAESVATEKTRDPLKGKALSGESWWLQLGGEGAKQTEKIIAPEPIAIVGYQSMAARCGDNDAFWRTIVDGQDQIDTLGAERLSYPAFLRTGSPTKLSTYTAQGAAMLDVGELDQLLPHPVMPAKRVRMDPVQKLAQICAAGALAETSVQGRSAIVVGSNLSLSMERELSTLDHWDQVRQCDPNLPPPNVPPINRFSLDGCSASGIARGISNIFKLNAECVAVEAACASSLAALHYAVKALQSGRIDTALCGGVEFAANERDMVLCSAQMMLSKDKIAPFSASADGFTPGDGGAFFALKRLSDVQAMDEPVLGIVHGISGSCDAKSMTAPDCEGQVLAIQKTLAQSEVLPAMVQYIEAHGTGTELGDKTEIDSIAACYSHESRATPLVIGSAKYNFGHCFAGAGAVGLSKVLLSFYHRVLPPTPPRGVYNPALPISAIPARILDCAESWQTGTNDSRFAALNSFGTGGINYHVILEQGH